MSTQQPNSREPVLIEGAVDLDAHDRVVVAHGASPIAGHGGDLAVLNPAPDASPSRTPTGIWRDVKICR
jgi:hypothetical protein